MIRINVAALTIRADRRIAGLDTTENQKRMAIEPGRYE
jgi:hypothetical protein